MRNLISVHSLKTKAWQILTDLGGVRVRAEISRRRSSRRSRVSVTRHQRHHSVHINDVPSWRIVRWELPRDPRELHVSHGSGVHNRSVFHGAPRRGRCLVVRILAAGFVFCVRFLHRQKIRSNDKTIYILKIIFVLYMLMKLLAFNSVFFV